LSSYSQKADSSSTYKTPRAVIEFGGAFDYPVQDAFGTVGEFFKFQNYGTVYGIGPHLNVKFCADKKGKFFPYITIGFVQLQNDDYTNAFIDSNNISNGYPLPVSQMYNLTSAAAPSVLILRDFYAGLGLQYVFISNRSVIPFIGFEIDYHLLWGLYTQHPGAVAGNNSTGQVTFSINPASRVGIGADAGFDLRIAQNLGFMFGIKYKFANLLGKQSERTQSSDLNTMNLLDKADTGLNTNLNKNRNIAYFQFYLGFAVFIGQVK
jgi:outer membrane protein W